MRIVIDLDGVICSIKKEGENYSDVAPLPGAVQKMQALKARGDYIIIHTARHMVTCNGDVEMIKAKVGKITTDWLAKHGIPYDELHFGKPHADVYLDDNSKVFLGWDDTSDITDYDPKKINIVIPIAGEGKRFVEAGYSLPKPLIDVRGEAMLKWATKSFDFLNGRYELQFIFVVLRDHVENYKIDEFIKNNYNNPIIIVIDRPTRGQAETCLLASKYINNYNKLIIYNGDTFTDYNIEEFPIDDRKLEGIIPCFESSEPRYSYCKLDAYGYVSEVVEKVVVSTHATAGLYYFRKGKDFVDYADVMIRENRLSAGEFYVGPLYNDLIKNGKRIKICPIKSNWVLGTPGELENFLKNYNTGVQ